MENEMIDETVQMWREHAAAAATVRKKALKYVEEHEFDSSTSAIQAIKWAQEEERKTRGAEAFITKLKNSSSEDLIGMVQELMERKAATEENVIDAESTEQLPEPK